MGLCFSCKRNQLKTEQFSASATPLHVYVEEKQDSTKYFHYSDYFRMANTISNMKMTNPIKNLVSKRRIRYTKDGFNLDLTCILFINLK